MLSTIATRIRPLLSAALLLLPCVTQAQSADRALSFTDSGYVDLGDPGDAFDFEPGGGRTYAFWVRHDTTLYHAKLLDKRTKGGPGATGVFGFSIFVQQFTGTLGLYLTPVREIPRADAFVGTAGLKPVIDKTWHHVAIVQDDDVVRAYVDGELDFSYDIPVSALVTDKPLWLGWNSRDIVHFRGQIDEFSIWRRAMSESEIHHLMYNRPNPNSRDLVGYWPFDEEDTSTVLDHSGHGYDGRAFFVDRIEASRPLHPPFRETIWFYVTVLMGAALGIGGISWLSAAGLRRRNRQLEAIIRDRTVEVERQAEELKTLDHAKSRFFANISHEFRTPLTIALGLLDDLLAGRQGALEDPMKEDLEQVKRSNRVLLRLVNQLLDVARIEAHELTLKIRHFDLAEALQVIGAAFSSVAQRDRIRFELDLPETFEVWLDPEQTELIVTNLLSNAFKYTPAAGSVHLELESGTQDGDSTAIIRVRDTGPGIPADRLPYVFDRFYQADESHQQIGTGIGLSFVKEVVELHGGSVRAESTVGSGTCFAVELPVAREPYEHHPSATVLDDSQAQSTTDGIDEVVGSQSGQHTPPSDDPATNAPLGTVDGDVDDRTTVLVVDDNADIRAFIKRQLGSVYRVVQAVDGAEALELAHAEPPDLVISDVMMPRLDGFGLVETMRADPDLDFVPIILLTARVESEDRLAGLGLGADAYLTKPFSTEELLVRVHNAIARQQRLRTKMLQELGARPDEGAGLHENGRSPGDRAPFVDQVRAIARQHLAEEGFGVEALADAMAMERSTLYRHVSEATGKPPTVFLRELRLQEAARLLEDHAGTVSEIAYAVGFQSISYFSRRFKEQFGTSPSQYRG